MLHGTQSTVGTEAGQERLWTGQAHGTHPIVTYGVSIYHTRSVLGLEWLLINSMHCLDPANPTGGRVSKHGLCLQEPVIPSPAAGAFCFILDFELSKFPVNPGTFLALCEPRPAHLPIPESQKAQEPLGLHLAILTCSRSVFRRGVELSPVPWPCVELSPVPYPLSPGHVWRARPRLSWGSQVRS